ncbi:glycine zipper 2TM domain-containing protein [Kaistia granuli]|uniref:glycine zipper 2TM domain-containing protein n=1 Tax=Kaistia granuli TaxID=363259 RepID=UPI000477AAFD|nr:glycine zipper 2TM domain-containing protein [Kaistia granuli]
MRLGSWCVVGVVAATLAGCASAGPNEGLGTVGGALVGGVIGNQFGSGSGRVAATAAGALIGGLVGQSVGRSLDDREQQRAREAEFQALEYGRPGSPIDWRGDRAGYRGEVTPGPRYRVNAYDCRDYTHRIWINGEPEVARGTACRQEDGTWRPIN